MLFHGKNVYISGPMTGKPNYNRDSFAEAEIAAYKRGASWVFNPCECYRLSGKMPNWTRERFMQSDVRMLVDSHAVIMLEGWEESAGATLEHAVATACGIEVVELSEI